jgi:hypothetical protein
MPEDYFCEECKPQYHVRFFEYGKGLDGPKTPRGIAKQRQRMHVMKRTDRSPEFREKMMWLTNELMAIVEGHSASLAAPWIFVSGLSEDVWNLKADSFGRMLILSIRIVRRNAEISPLLEFRAKLNQGSVQRSACGCRTSVDAEGVVDPGVHDEDGDSEDEGVAGGKLRGGKMARG